jgi:hypothetical protein
VILPGNYATKLYLPPKTRVGSVWLKERDGEAGDFRVLEACSPVSESLVSIGEDGYRHATPVNHGSRQGIQDKNV